jgi:hypothetical protein
MNVTYVKTKNYEQKPMDNEPIKQTQTKPTYGEHSRTISWTSAAKVCDEAVRLPHPQGGVRNEGRNSAEVEDGDFGSGVVEEFSVTSEAAIDVKFFATDAIQSAKIIMNCDFMFAVFLPYAQPYAVGMPA